MFENSYTVVKFSTLFSTPFNYLQLKVKEERETKRASIDARHSYIASVLCTKLTMSPSEVEETFLEGDQVGVTTGCRCV